MRYHIFLSIILPLVFMTVACTAPNKARDALQKAGYTHIQTKGHDFFMCGEDDVSSTKFTARNPQGVQVSGAVCCGILKGCTIRF